MIETVKISQKLNVRLIVAILPLLLWSCDRDPIPGAYKGGSESDIVGIGASIVSRSEASSDGDGDDNTGNNSDDNDQASVDDLAAYVLSLGSGTYLHVSQLTSTQTPFWDDDITYSYQYIDEYQYDGDDAWMDDNCYNYAPYMQDDPLEWSKIYSLGTYAGGYAMFCMYFPKENKVLRRNNANGKVTYYVQEDQSTVDNLMRSDILAAYHSTPSIFSRIKFRLFHLMTYVRIRLYVPVYREDLNTGYREGALNYATLNNVTPHFSIDWSTIRSTDTEAPPVKGLTEDELEQMLDGQTPSDDLQTVPDDAPESLSSSIKMYQHPLTAGMTEHPKTKIEYARYLGNYFDQGLGDEKYDEVRIYDFSVIIPVQGEKTVTGADGQKTKTDFTKTDFLNFYFRTNSGAETRYYFNRDFASNDIDSKLDMSQGNFQYLQLYVPRVGNAVVYVGAHVNRWEQKGSEMLLQPSDQKN